MLFLKSESLDLDLDLDLNLDLDLDLQVPLAMSEIGVSMPDESFGKEAYLAKGLSLLHTA